MIGFNMGRHLIAIVPKLELGNEGRFWGNDMHRARIDQPVAVCLTN
jgi:hypothetical protein